MKSKAKCLLLASCLILGAGILSGCASTAHGKKAAVDPFNSQFDTFGRAVRQDIAAQVADPDPAWKGSPPPPTDGRRVEETQKAYHKEQSTTSTSTSFSLPGGIQ